MSAAPIVETCQSYHRDGFHLLRSAITSDRVAQLRAAVDYAVAHPSPLGQEFKEGQGGGYYSDLYLSIQFEGFKDILGDPVISEVAGVLEWERLMLFNYELLVKQPGSPVRTPWHHDVSYWPLQGTEIASLWIPLDPIDEESGCLEFVKASHRWKKTFNPRNFDTGLSRVTSPEHISLESEALDSGDFFTTKLDAGDALLFDARTLHRAAANSKPDASRRVVVLRLVGEKVVYRPMPNTIPLIWAPSLSPGQELCADAALFPTLWQSQTPGGRESRR